MGEGSYRCMKVLIIVGNLVLMAIGIAAIATGIYTKIQIDNNDLQASGAEAFNLAPIGLILIGFCIVFLGALGTWGAGKENRGYLGFYLLLTLILVVAQFGLGVYGAIKFLNTNGTNATIYNVLDTQWDKASPTDRQAIEDTFSCCGWTSPTDHSTDNCTFTEGCKEKVGGWIKTNVVIVIGSVLGFMCIQLFWLVLSCCFFRAVGKVKKEENKKLLDEAYLVNRNFR